MQRFALNVTVVAVFSRHGRLASKGPPTVRIPPEMPQQRYSSQAAYSVAIAEHDLAELSAKIDAALRECEQRRLTPGNAEEAEAVAEGERALRMVQSKRNDLAPLRPY